MFDDKTIKLKKNQFIEAESIAYLINDIQKRKIAFLNTCALFALKNYFEKNKYPYEPITKTNLFRVPIVFENYEISDLYIGNARIDVRVSINEKDFPIPKTHIKNSIAADFYIVFKPTKNPLKCEILGYVKKDELVFDSQDKDYYYISNSILNPIQNLKNEINTFSKEIKQFYETEHKIAIENFGEFLDSELEYSKAQDLIEHLLECEECRGLFVEYSFLEDVLTAIKHYPDIKLELRNYIESEEYLQKHKEEENEIIIEEPAEEVVEEPAEEVIEEPAEEIIEEPNEEVIEEPNEEVEPQSDINEENNLSIEDEEDINIEEENEINIEEVSNEENIEEIELQQDLNEEGIIIETEENVIIENEERDSNLYEIVEDNESNENLLTIEDTSIEEDNEPIVNEEENIEEIFIEDDLKIVSQDEEKITEIDSELTQSIIATDEQAIIKNEDIEEEDDDEILNNLKSSNNDIPQTEISFDTNWNELFSNSGKNDEDSKIEETQPTPINSNNLSSIYNDETIQNFNSNEKLIKNIERNIEKTKSPVGVTIAIIIATIIITFATIGFLILNNTTKVNGNKGAENNEAPFVAENSQDINETITTAFSEAPETLRITNVSWLKNKNIEITPEFKEYLSILGTAIWDELEYSIKEIQGYNVTNELKIIISINEKGKISDVINAQTSGSKEVDNFVLKNVKSILNNVQPSDYNVSGKNIDIILVVNF